MATPLTTKCVNISDRFKECFNYGNAITTIWGIKEGAQLCPQACLRCRQILQSIETFRGSGPSLKTHYLFCDGVGSCSSFYFKLIRELEEQTKAEGKNFESELNALLKPLQNIEKVVRESFPQAAKPSNRAWEYLGSIDRSRL